MGDFIVNGLDTRSAFGFKLGRDMAGWRDGLSSSRPSRSTPDGYGERAVSKRASADPRTIRLSGWQGAADMATLQDLWREFRAHLQGGLLEVSFSDDSSRFFRAEARNVTARGIGAQMVQARHRVDVTLRALDPLVYRKQGDVVSLTDSPRQIPTGSGPGEGVVEISGPVTDPTVTYKDHRGATVGTLGLTVSLTSSESREIDLTAQTIVDGSGASALSELSSGDFFSVSGEHAAGEDGPHPTLEVAPAPGAATYRGRRAWI